MTPHRFKIIAITLYGKEHWMRDVAKALGKDRITVWRWMKRGEIPSAIGLAVDHLGDKHAKSKAERNSQD